MGNMGQQSLGNTTSISFLHHLRDLWKSPRGTVLRIEALALVAIALSFFLAAFGSCRRWSNSWFIQKGFLAANAVFLSLGTYSIGLMQSSPVKSEMYPIWAVSLLALLCCVDSAAASGLDNKSQLWKMLYQLCLYFGYVLLMSISTISSDIGNIAICVLSALTFIKGFHRSMALVLPSSMRNMIREIQDDAGKVSFDGDSDKERYLLVDMNLDIMTEGRAQVVMDDIPYRLKDVCLSFSLSHLLHRRFLGLSSIVEPTGTDDTWPLVDREDYERAFMVVETELAFLYDVLYTSNPFLHYYEAKSASIWACASVIGICFVGAVAVIPGARTNRRASPGTIVVDATTADFVITGVILVSLALLQVLQLLRCWTSNWARVSLACDWVRKNYYEDKNESVINWLGFYLRLSLVKIDWFDKYLWQNKLGQYSLIESTWVPGHNLVGLLRGLLGSSMGSCKIIQKCCGLLGLQYIGRVLQELLQGSNTEVSVELYADVKSSIGDFVGKITCDEVRGWESSSVENGRSGLVEYDPWVQSCRGWFESSIDDEIYVSCILMWHIATCYCELAQQHDHDDNDSAAVQKDRRVATTLSKYCAYLVVSAPRLLPGRSETIKRVSATAIEIGKRLPMDKMLAMETFDVDTVFLSVKEYVKHDLFRLKSFFSYVDGVKLGKGLQRKTAADLWKVMAEFWVKALVYAAPSDKSEEHLQHLSQGGELITHLWALLYHIGIHRWQLPPQQPLAMGWDYIFRIRSWQDYYTTTECTARR